MFWKRKPKYKAPLVTDETFQELVVNSKVPVLLDFYADWCGPCKILGPFVDELAQEYEGKALVAKVNSEANPKLGHHFKIKSIPTILFFHKGELVERYQGLIPKPNLAAILEEYLADDAEKKEEE